MPLHVVPLPVPHAWHLVIAATLLLGVVTWAGSCGLRVWTPGCRIVLIAHNRKSSVAHDSKAVVHQGFMQARASHTSFFLRLVNESRDSSCLRALCANRFELSPPISQVGSSLTTNTAIHPNKRQH